MKNLKLKIVTAFICTSSFALAQGIYVEINAGYGLPFNTNKNIIGESSSMSTYSNGDYSSSGSHKNIDFSLGKGVNFGATIGYMFNKFLGAEVQYTFLMGASSEGSYSSTHTDEFGGQIETSTYSSTESYSSNFSRIIPAIVLQPGFEKINPYAKIGGVLGFGSVAVENDASENYNGMTNTTYVEVMYNGGVAIGLNTRFGVLFSCGSKLSYFAELNFLSMNYSFTEGEVMVFKEDGVDMLPTLTVSERRAEFSDEVFYSDEENENQPYQAAKISLPFGSMGLNIGVRLAL